MKICYLSDATSIHTKKWSRFFSKRGHEVTVLSLRPETIPGVKTILFGKDELRRKKNLRVFDYLKNYREVKKIVSKIQPDILHAQYASNYGVLGALSGFHPLVTTIWGSDLFIFPKRSVLHEAILKFNLKKADLITVSSQVMKTRAMELTKTPIQLIPFGVDLDMFTYGTKDSNTFTVGITKALEKIYGIDDLVRAFKLFLDRNPTAKARLLIVGEGSQRTALQKLARQFEIEDGITFTGHLPIDKVAEEYRKMDITVFPSYSESFCVSAVESQACGVPVVATNIGGFLESTRPGVTSFLVEVGDIYGLADSIERLYNDKDLRVAMGKKGREFVEETFNIENNFELAEKLYQDLLK